MSETQPIIGTLTLAEYIAHAKAGRLTQTIFADVLVLCRDEMERLRGCVRWRVADMGDLARGYDKQAARIAKLEAELRVRDWALEEACKTRPLLLCNTPGASDCRHQTAEFYMQIAREALAREQEAENAD